jgi:hypothetical protein
MFNSANFYIDRSIDVSYILFTDVNVLPANIKAHKVALHLADHLPWPLPTLLRFHKIIQVAKEVNTDYLMYLDADMLFRESFSLEDLSLSDQKGIVLVAHPGYFRAGNNGISIQRKLKDRLITIRNGALGTWETRRRSGAYVRRSLRKNYVCGGTWWGHTQPILKMCESLMSKIEEDLSTNIIAQYHDESHLNRWASENEFTLASPQYCYEPTYSNLVNTKCTIEAVNKNLNHILDDTTRIQS